MEETFQPYFWPNDGVPKICIPEERDSPPRSECAPGPVLLIQLESLDARSYQCLDLLLEGIAAIVDKLLLKA